MQILNDQAILTLSRLS